MAGTAVVVYAVLLQAVKAGGIATWLASGVSTVGAWHILWVVVRMSIIGPLFGAFLGVLSVKWLEANAGADRDANVEVCLWRPSPSTARLGCDHAAVG
jgi:hypothetical protein